MFTLKETTKNITETHKKTVKQILFLSPVLQEKIWGGTRLQTEWHYALTGKNAGECWAISANPSGDCIIKNGFFAGKSLSELWTQERALFGDLEGACFPLLVKIIDAKEDLSIQVHPDQAYAYAHEHASLGKTECWYVLDCPEDSHLIIGHHAKDKAQLMEMIHEKKWNEFLQKVPVQKGDFIQIEAGTVHAITAGVMVLETQQNSDITYRIYDYDRLSVDGTYRELHIEKSIDVIKVPSKKPEDLILHEQSLTSNCIHTLISCEQYEVFLLQITNRFSFTQEYPFLNVSVIEGEGSVNNLPIKKGDHFIIPNEFGEITMNGHLKLILSSVPK